MRSKCQSALNNSALKMNMWNILLKPDVYWPLAINLLLGFAICAFTRGMAWCFLVWFFVPLKIAAVYVGPHIYESRTPDIGVNQNVRFLPHDISPIERGA